MRHRDSRGLLATARLSCSVNILNINICFPFDYFVQNGQFQLLYSRIYRFLRKIWALLSRVMERILIVGPLSHENRHLGTILRDIFDRKSQ